MSVSRRDFMTTGVGGLVATGVMTTSGVAAPPPGRSTRGVILYPFDLSLADWPARAAKAGLNTIALHAAQRLDVLSDYMQSEAGEQFLADCKQHGIAVEYELHAMGELLSRELYYKDPTLFRLDENGRRNADSNCNPFSDTALDIIAEKAVERAQLFRSSTGRYFYWPDDGARWDFSPQADGLNASDQALLVENHILKALRKHIDPQATLSHISYHQTLAAPNQIKPEEGIFLEFAPILRDFSKSIAQRDAKTRRPSKTHPDPDTNGEYLDILAANMEIFGPETTQVLDYWLDVSLFSGWTRPAVELPWNEAVFKSDIAAYRKLGVKHITTFATYIDADYVKLHGDPQPILDSYGSGLRES